MNIFLLLYLCFISIRRIYSNFPFIPGSFNRFNQRCRCWSIFLSKMYFWTKFKCLLDIDPIYLWNDLNFWWLKGRNMFYYLFLAQLMNIESNALDRNFLWRCLNCNWFMHIIVNIIPIIILKDTYFHPMKTIIISLSRCINQINISNSSGVLP